MALRLANIDAMRRGAARSYLDVLALVSASFAPHADVASLRRFLIED
jgi:hypothetical protein